MTNKDFIKLLLVSCGFSKEIKIEGWNSQDGSYMYDVSAKSEEEDDLYVSFFNDFMGLIRDILDEVDELRHPSENKIYVDGTKVKPLKARCDFRTHLLPMKSILNDEKREAYIKEQEERDARQEAYCAYMHPVWEIDSATQPCKGCTENLHDINDSINYNCSLHYYNACEKVHRWRDECSKRDREATNKYEETLKNEKPKKSDNS